MQMYICIHMVCMVYTAYLMIASVASSSTRVYVYVGLAVMYLYSYPKSIYNTHPQCLVCKTGRECVCVCLCGWSYISSVLVRGACNKPLCSQGHHPSPPLSLTRSLLHRIFPPDCSIHEKVVYDDDGYIHKVIRRTNPLWDLRRNANLPQIISFSQTNCLPAKRLGEQQQQHLG